MPCFCPLTAYRARGGGVTFQRGLSISGVPMSLPCGQCVGCRLEKSRQWAMRCLHEKKLWKDNCFVTLTYDKEHLPPAGTLVKRDMQLFMKRLRFAREPSIIRFYGCGEYGDLNRRPHYHILLFNCDFPDRKQIAENARGEPYWTSAELMELWGAGRCIVGAVTFESAAYVARYIMKKITNKPEAYDVVDGDGVVHRRASEFTLMSRRPGIGSGYYERYGSEVRAHDSVVVSCREVRPPRFYDTRTEQRDPARFLEIQRKRRRAALLLRDDNTVDRRRVKEILALKRLKEKRRAL